MSKQLADSRAGTGGSTTPQRADDENSRNVWPLVSNELRLLSLKDVAKVLCVSERTMESLISTGAFPRPIRVGGQRRWHPSTVTAWIAGQEEN